ncbi:hypothetical protein PIB30_067001 [Stylosanthes scabra]|uniref:DUF223 domain-containing protein n=1 Tax=Stylosanthes scabra TaxID=79078 RepID=A0ABU6UN30_9FABA|nr:hypothetical protein [Stylosanthes scabra]
MVIQDSEGVRVYASIPRPLVRKWLGIIKEFRMYEMANFIVVDKKPFIRPFNEILNGVNDDDSEMFDIIGEVVGKEEARKFVTSKGLLVKRMVVVLEDLGSNRLCCVLFGDLVD